MIGVEKRSLKVEGSRVKEKNQEERFNAEGTETGAQSSQRRVGESEVQELKGGAVRACSKGQVLRSEKWYARTMSGLSMEAEDIKGSPNAQELPCLPA